mmetsp:Transcript_26304/g.53653  ORF Transcript_26304/g.53653 Transcript_26304/m.53653 type:complete len:306 (-) Transcript_26304:1507-2424(-)
MREMKSTNSYFSISPDPSLSICCRKKRTPSRSQLEPILAICSRMSSSRTMPVLCLSKMLNILTAMAERLSLPLLAFFWCSTTIANSLKSTDPLPSASIIRNRLLASSSLRGVPSCSTSCLTSPSSSSPLASSSYWLNSFSRSSKTWGSVASLSCTHCWSLIDLFSLTASRSAELVCATDLRNSTWSRKKESMVRMRMMSMSFFCFCSRTTSITTSLFLSISVEQHHVYSTTMRGVRKIQTTEGRSAMKGSTGLSSQSGPKSTTQRTATETTEARRTSLMKVRKNEGPEDPNGPKSCSCLEGLRVL